MAFGRGLKIAAIAVAIALAAGRAPAANGAAAAAPAAAPQTQNPTQATAYVDLNQSLFVVLAAINVAGYDDGLNSPDGSPLRLEVRSALLAQPLPVIDQLRDFYKSHMLPDASQNLAQYISLALFLGSAPRLRLTVAPQDLPPDAAAIQDLLPLLRRFYDDDNLAALWQQEQPKMQQAVAGFAPAVRAALEPVDIFLRLPQGSTGRSLVILPEPLISPAQINARAYLDNYYIVTGMDAGRRINEIRHTYLQFVIDPIVSALPTAEETMQPILTLVQRAPALDPELKQNGGQFYTECLVRAIEIQIDPGTPQQKKQRVDAAMADGLLVTRYWYDTLNSYRKDVVSFKEFYSDAAFAISVPEVVYEGNHTVFAAAAPELTAMPRAVRMESVLAKGEDLLDTGNLAGVEQLANQALASPSDHASAHYLLALVALHRNQAAAANTEFAAALAAASDTDRHVKTWSNIYLGRLSDVSKNRDAAVAHYKAALETADTDQERALAHDGIDKPFQAPTPPAGRGH